MAEKRLGTKVRREQIAQAATGLIAAHGVRGLSMAALARRVGLVPSAIYRHFRGKEEVLDAVVDLLRSRLEGNVRTVCEETREPLERLRRLLARFAALIREGQATPRIVFSEDMAAGSPQRRRRIVEMLQSDLRAVAGIIRQGQEEGRLRSDLRPETLAVMFIGLFLPAATLWQITDGGFDVTRHTERAWSVFRDAVSPAGAGRAARRKRE